MKEKRPKKTMDYVTAHNRAVNWFRRTSRFIFWVGILAVFATVIGIVQMVRGSYFKVDDVARLWPLSGFSLSFSFHIFLAYICLAYIPSSIVAEIVIILIVLVLGGGFAALGIFASKGKLVFLIVSTSLYLLDFASVFPVYYYVYPNTPLNYSWTNYAFMIAVHVIVLSAMVISLIEYYRVLDIEKKFHGVKKVSVEEEVESEVIASGQ